MIRDTVTYPVDTDVLLTMVMQELQGKGRQAEAARILGSQQTFNVESRRLGDDCDTIWKYVELIMPAIQEAMRCERASVVMRAESSTLSIDPMHSLHFIAGYAGIGESMPSRSFILGGDMEIIPGLLRERRISQDIGNRTGRYHTNSLMMLIGQQDYQGALCISNRLGGNDYRDVDKALLAILAGEMTREMLCINQKKEQIDVLVEALGMKDSYTAHHSRAVALLSGYIARLCGYSIAESMEVETLAGGHDVGKMAIAEYILTKEGVFVWDERSRMQLHTVEGAKLLESTLPSYARVARQHHEWWNGKGYPDGLAGEEIHINARIAALADVYEALRATRRTYKPGFGRERTLAIMMEERGTHFDPDLWQVFMGGLADMAFVGRGSPVYHNPFCVLSPNIPAKKLAIVSVDDAIDAELVPCQKCAGHYDRPIVIEPTDRLEHRPTAA